MSTSILQTTLLPESTSTKILCFACKVPSHVQESASTLNDENDDFEDPLKSHNMSMHQSLSIPSLDLENVGIVGTITLLGHSTAMIWVGWGRFQDKDHQGTLSVAARRNLGAGTVFCYVQKLLCLLSFPNFIALSHFPFPTNIESNLLMGPLMVSLPRKSYQGAFASDIPSSKLISVSDLESDLMASQMSERLSQQLQMAVLVSCHFDDASAPKSAMGTGMNDPDVENHMLRRRALTIAEKEICQLIKQHELQT